LVRTLRAKSRVFPVEEIGYVRRSEFRARELKRCEASEAHEGEIGSGEVQPT
jgi:hypothetical protein